MADLGAMELQQFQSGMTDQQKMMFMAQYSSDKKDRTIALILSVFLGYLGIDRFYVGDIGLGIFKLLTGGVCGVLWLVDLFLISGRIDDYNRRKAQEIAQALKMV